MAKILIVDDQESLRKSLRNWLTVSLRHCEFFEAESGEQAIAVSVRQAPEIVLMDYGLGTMVGIETARRIKKYLPDSAVVIISAQEEEYYQIEAANAGVSRFIPRRTMQRELVSALNELLGKSRRAKRSVAN